MGANDEGRKKEKGRGAMSGDDEASHDGGSTGGSRSSTSGNRKGELDVVVDVDVGKVQPPPKKVVGEATEDDDLTPSSISWLESMSYSKQLFITTTGVFMFFIAYFVFEEKIMKHSEVSRFPTVMSMLIPIATFTYTSSIALFTTSQRKGPIALYAVIGLLSGLESLSSTFALSLLNFPTWVIFKSSGLLTTMLGSILILHRSFTLAEYGRALMIIVGLVLFSLGDIQADVKFDPLGLLLVFLSLGLASAESNFQEFALRRYSVSQFELLRYASFFNIVLILIIVFFDEDVIAINITFKELITLALAGSLGSFGLFSLIHLLKLTDAVMVAIVTVIRKSITILLSFLIFSKPWSSNYLYGGIVMAVGVIFEINSRRHSKAAQVAAPSDVKSSDENPPENCFDQFEKYISQLD